MNFLDYVWYDNLNWMWVSCNVYFFDNEFFYIKQGQIVLILNEEQ